MYARSIVDCPVKMTMTPCAFKAESDRLDRFRARIGNVGPSCSCGTSCFPERTLHVDDCCPFPACNTISPVSIREVSMQQWHETKFVLTDSVSSSWGVSANFHGTPAGTIPDFRESAV